MLMADAGGAVGEADAAGSRPAQHDAAAADPVGMAPEGAGNAFDPQAAAGLGGREEGRPQGRAKGVFLGDPRLAKPDHQHEPAENRHKAHQQPQAATAYIVEPAHGNRQAGDQSEQGKQPQQQPAKGGKPKQGKGEEDTVLKQHKVPEFLAARAAGKLGVVAQGLLYSIHKFHCWQPPSMKS